MKIRFVFTALLLGLAAPNTESADAVKLEPVTVGSAVFQVEMARTAQERGRGLMFRTELPKDRGMRSCPRIGECCSCNRPGRRCFG